MHFSALDLVPVAEGVSETSPTQLPLPFEGCRGYEWAYAEGYMVRQADPVDGG